MLTAAKTSLTVLMKSFRLKHLKEKCGLEHYQQLSLKYFVKSFSVQKLSSKVSSIQTTISGGTLKC